VDRITVIGVAARCRLQIGDSADWKSALQRLAVRTVSRSTSAQSAVDFENQIH
jgi:hypothetical protein